jgi:hypothetical protein
MLRGKRGFLTPSSVSYDGTPDRRLEKRIKSLEEKISFDRFRMSAGEVS